MTYAMFINTKAGKPADVRGDFAPAMNRVADAGTLFIERVEGIAEGLGG
jgi:hypothetical protein